jgi:hypothetical protein
MKTFISTVSTTGTLYMECDDNVITAFFNNEIVFSSSGSIGHWVNVYNTQVQIKTGSNSIVLLVQNYGGPAGLLASLYYSGSYIVNTDSTWTWTYNLPAPTPDPTASPSTASDDAYLCYHRIFKALEPCIQDIEWTLTIDQVILGRYRHYSHYHDINSVIIIITTLLGHLQ